MRNEQARSTHNLGNRGSSQAMYNFDRSQGQSLRERDRMNPGRHSSKEFTRDWQNQNIY